MKGLKYMMGCGIVLAGVGLGSLCGGCDENLTDGDLFNAGMRGLGLKSGTAKGAYSGAVLGELGKTPADRQHQLNVAGEIGAGSKIVPTLIYYKSRDQMAFFDGKGNGWEVQSINREGKFTYNDGQIVPDSVRRVCME